MPAHRCLVCRKIITWNFAICANCERDYGSVAREWPQWLRFLWSDEQRIRRNTRVTNAYEVSLEQLSEVISTEPQGGGRRVARHVGWEYKHQ